MTESPPLAPDLVVEVMVRDLDASLAFYAALGFELERRSDGFAVLRWGGRQLFLDERQDLSALAGPERANLRIMVPDVDAMWDKARELDLPVQKPLGDRSYGLRDFTVSDPDGFGLRFAARLEEGDESK